MNQVNPVSYRIGYGSAIATSSLFAGVVVVDVEAMVVLFVAIVVVVVPGGTVVVVDVDVVVTSQQSLASHVSLVLLVPLVLLVQATVGRGEINVLPEPQDPCSKDELLQVQLSHSAGHCNRNAWLPPHVSTYLSLQSWSL